MSGSELKAKKGSNYPIKVSTDITIVLQSFPYPPVAHYTTRSRDESFYLQPKLLLEVRSRRLKPQILSSFLRVRFTRVYTVTFRQKT